MSFNPDPFKQAQELIFTRKVKNVAHQPISLMANQFNKFHQKSTWILYIWSYIRQIFNL